MTARGGVFRLAWNGEVLECEKLAGLLFRFSEGLFGFELGAALLAAGRLYQEVEIRAKGGAIRLRGDSFDCTQDSRDTDCTVVNLRQPVGWVRRVRGMTELSMVRDRCSHAELSWRFPIFYKSPRVRLKGPVVRLGVMRKLPGPTLHFREPGHDIGYGYFVLEGRRRQGTLVYQGVDYPLNFDFTDAPGRLVWWNDNLKLNLSYSEIVEDEHYLNWREKVRILLEVALKETLAKCDDLAAEAIQGWLMWRGVEKAESTRLRSNALREICEQNIRTMQYKDALAAARKAADLDSYYHAYEAICLGLLGRFGEAATLYEFALESYKEAWIHANYAEDLELMGQREGALEQIERALELEPRNPHAMALKAKLICVQHSSAARALLLDALEQEGCPASAWETLATVYLSTEEQPAAKQALENFLKYAAAETLWENDLPTRLLKAKETLARLNQPSTVQ